MKKSKTAISEPVGKYIDFVQKNIILTAGDDVYVTQTNEFEIKNLNPIEFNRRKTGNKYFYKKHLMIINYIKNNKVKLEIDNFIRNYNNIKNVTANDNILHNRMQYFIIGNRDWIVNTLNKYPTLEKYNKIESESIRLVLRNLLLTLNNKSFNIEAGIPISVINNGKISNSVQIFNALKDDIISASSKNNKYNFPPLVINAMYYKMKIDENTWDVLTKDLSKKGTIDSDQMSKYVDDFIERADAMKTIKEEIDLVSLGNSKENIYMIIQMLGKMFNEKQLNSVINSIPFGENK